MELYARVRRAVLVDQMSEREAARQFGLAREGQAQTPRPHCDSTAAVGHDCQLKARCLEIATVLRHLPAWEFKSALGRKLAKEIEGMR